MKYYLDEEFIEGFHKPFLGKKRHFIDLVSIGLVCEDGREYYAISKEFSARKASLWVQKNVLEKLPSPNADQHDSPKTKQEALLWKSNDTIRHDLLDFFNCWPDKHGYRAPDGIRVYGYYADYDWVLFCSLFGTMMDLPEGFPKYCRDLKQILDEKDLSIAMRKQGDYQLSDLLKGHPNFPKQENEHNALDDARWNKKLHEFLIGL